MSPEKFSAAMDRIKAEQGLDFGAQSEAIGKSRGYLSDCRAGRQKPSRTIIMALRALDARVPPMPEEGEFFAESAKK